MKKFIHHILLPIFFVILIIESIFFHKEPTNSDLLIFIAMLGGLGYSKEKE